ncbi:MAG: radical SAM protein [Elusimicrobia bacterium]|nr:radical SAM protein [Elusimicrobiota bacterium]
MELSKLKAPLFVSWQLTRDCDLSCLHCCTGSAPGRPSPNELNREEALRLADDLLSTGVPYVMLCGGEPALSPHFFEVAERLGRGGVQLKIETNGQRFGAQEARRLRELPIRSVQVSLDGDTPEAYRSLRPNGSLEKAWLACRAVREAGLPLEAAFAPCRSNIREAEAVICRALELGAFRFNTGMLMRIGTAVKFWDRLAPTEEDYDRFFSMLERKEVELAGRIEVWFRPHSLDEALELQLREPPAALLVLPDGLVKVSAALSFICADLRTQSVSQAWGRYLSALGSLKVFDPARFRLAGANAEAVV